MDSKSSKKRVKQDATEVLSGLKKVASLPTLVKNKGGAPSKEDRASKEIELSNKDLEILSVLLASKGNKSLTERITGVNRKRLYRLLNSDRVDRLVGVSRLRLKALIEAAVIVLEKAVIEDGDVEVAQLLVKTLLLKSREGNTGKQGKGRKASVEEWVDEKGTPRRRQTLEETT